MKELTYLHTVHLSLVNILIETNSNNIDNELSRFLHTELRDSLYHESDIWATYFDDELYYKSLIYTKTYLIYTNTYE